MSEDLGVRSPKAEIALHKFWDTLEARSWNVQTPSPTPSAVNGKRPGKQAPHLRRLRSRSVLRSQRIASLSKIPKSNEAIAMMSDDCAS